MQINRTAASIAITLACALAPHASAQPGADSALSKGGLAYTLETDGKSGALLGAQGLTGGMAARGAPDAKPSLGLSEITLTAGTGLPQAFYAWVSAALVGRPMPFAATVHGVGAAGRIGESASFASPRLISITLSALDQASRAPMRMDVRMQAAVKVEPAKPTKAPKPGPHAASGRWLVSGYRLTLGKIDASHVGRIGAITLSPGTGAQLELATSGATAEAFAHEAPTPKQRAARPIDDGRLELVGADGSPLATLELQGVQIVNLHYTGPAAAPARGPRPAMVTIFAKRAELKFAPSMSH